MKTKLSFLCGVIFMASLNVKAETITNGVYATTNFILSLNGKRGLPQPMFRADELIYISVIGTSTNPIEYRVFPFDQGYAFLLFDEKGREVPKTKKGLANSKPAHPPKNMREWDAFKLRVVRQNASDDRALFRPDEMFVITNKGSYALEVRMRIFVPTTNGVPDYKAMKIPSEPHYSNTHFDAVVSAPMRVTVIKE